MTGGAASGRRGAKRERELVGRLRDAGYGALRLPSSGSATQRDLPDVLAGHPHWYSYGISNLIAVEVKSGKATTLYVNADEVTALKAFAATWGATPYLAARSTQQATDTRHYLVAPEDARRTGAGAYGLPIDGIEERASVVVGPEGVTLSDSKYKFNR